MSRQSDPVGVEIAALAALLDGLSGERWDAPSLCEAWRVRDVVAHVVAGEQGAFALPAVIGGMLRHRFDFDRWVAVDGQRRGEQDPAAILQALREAGTSRKAGAGGVRALAHVLIHGQDVCRPLALSRQLPDSHLVAVADFVASSIIFRARKRIAGVRLLASDVKWSCGAGPEVTGPAEALVMTMAGRLVALDDLSGEGVDVLRRSFQ